jgi:hypothetical protein
LRNLNNSVVKNVLVSNGWWLYLGHTYDNGDKTDSWCHSQTPVPAGLIPDSAYYPTTSEVARGAFMLTRNGFVSVFATSTANALLCIEA